MPRSAAGDHANAAPATPLAFSLAWVLVSLARRPFFSSEHRQSHPLSSKIKSDVIDSACCNGQPLPKQKLLNMPHDPLELMKAVLHRIQGAGRRAGGLTLLAPEDVLLAGVVVDVADPAAGGRPAAPASLQAGALADADVEHLDAALADGQVDGAHDPGPGARGGPAPLPVPGDVAVAHHHHAPRPGPGRAQDGLRVAPPRVDDEQVHALQPRHRRVRVPDDHGRRRRRRRQWLRGRVVGLRGAGVGQHARVAAARAARGGGEREARGRRRARRGRGGRGRRRSLIRVRVDVGASTMSCAFQPPAMAETSSATSAGPSWSASTLTPSM
ncbi:hypothetical protein EJB05_21772, partial [Eragrostis curvula]